MKIIAQQISVPVSYPVIFTRDVFDRDNDALPRVFRQSGQRMNRVLMAIDSSVVDTKPARLEKIEAFAGHHADLFQFVDSPLIVRGGEICKKDPAEVAAIHALVDRHRVCRHSFVLAVGGGAVLDAVGYAAATAHRGVRLIRLPTTTLAQNDAGVGVKNGVNGFGRKNYLGTFAPPYAVINDFDFLDTLSARDLRSGMSEAVKVALIKDPAFFDFLYRERQNLAAFAPAAMEHLIVRCAELHLEHMALHGDPFEYGSSRPLDFGHWAAHTIEELTGGEVRHGEAVAIGVALDSLYSFHAGFIDELELERILILLETLGFELYHWALGWMDVEKSLCAFQEHLGGRLSLPLLRGIGRMADVQDIDATLMKKCIGRLAARKKEAKTAHDFTRQPEIGARVTGSLLS